MHTSKLADFLVNLNMGLRGIVSDAEFGNELNTLADEFRQFGDYPVYGLIAFLHDAKRLLKTDSGVVDPPELARFRLAVHSSKVVEHGDGTTSYKWNEKVNEALEGVQRFMGVADKAKSSRKSSQKIATEPFVPNDRIKFMQQRIMTLLQAGTDGTAEHDAAVNQIEIDLRVTKPKDKVFSKEEVEWLAREVAAFSLKGKDKAILSILGKLNFKKNAVLSRES